MKIKKTKVIMGRNLPMKPPIQITIIGLLALDVWKASDLIYGICISFILMMWIVSIFAMGTQESVDLFDEDKK